MKNIFPRRKTMHSKFWNVFVNAAAFFLMRMLLSDESFVILS